MTEQDFRNIVSGIIKQHPQISSDNMKGMIEDVWHSFEETTVFSQIKVRRTGRIEDLIEVMCRCSDSGASGPEIARRLELIWLDDLRYRSGEESHIVVQTNDSVILKAVTVPGSGDYYVTLKVNVSLISAVRQDFN